MPLFTATASPIRDLLKKLGEDPGMLDAQNLRQFILDIQPRSRPVVASWCSVTVQPTIRYCRWWPSIRERHPVGLPAPAFTLSASTNSRACEGRHILRKSQGTNSNRKRRAIRGKTSSQGRRCGVHFVQAASET